MILHQTAQLSLFMDKCKFSTHVVLTVVSHNKRIVVFIKGKGLPILTQVSVCSTTTVGGNVGLDF